MLSHNTALATIAVKDMTAARRFYEQVLELKPASVMGDKITTYLTGDSSVFVYQSEYAGGYGATVATWVIDDDIERIVAELKENGVSFTHYDGMGLRREGDLHVSEDGVMKAAWFQDPDGNIIALVSEGKE